MHLSAILALSAHLLTLVNAQGPYLQPPTVAALPAADAPTAAAGAAETPAAGSKTKGNVATTFNGKTVPPITQLTTATLDDTIKTGNWLVEFFSPYCHHCKSFAPTYQTLHEFYYTSEVVPAGVATTDKTMNSFTEYYDFRIAKVDCSANGDICTAHNITQYPSFKVYKSGQHRNTEVAARSLKEMSTWVEEVLEEIHPGSRPVGGPKLPAVGASVIDAELPGSAVKASDATALPKAELSVSAAKSIVTATRVSKSNETPNALGKSVKLSAENFQKLVTMTGDPWFIKFHVPWCSHCLELAPKWQEMARQKQGLLNVGEVNCEEDKRLCKDVNVKGYPTMIFFLGGDHIEYHGLRGLGDLIDYGTSAATVASGVRELTLADFEELEKTEEVLFLYIHDAATTSEDFAALERLTMNMIGHAKLFKSSDPLLAQRFKISTWPTFIVSRDGVPAKYDGLSPRDMRDVPRILDWMRTVWLPIVPELTAANALDIMRDKIVVLGILSRERPDDLAIAKREIKSAALEWIDKQEQQFQLELNELRAAKQLRIEEAEDRDDQRALRAAKSIRINRGDLHGKSVTFAWVDGTFWDRWVRTTYGISVKDGDRVIINDEANRGFWDNTITGNPIVPSRTSILETLPKVVANPPKIRAKTTHTTMDHFWWTIKRGIVRHPIINGLVALTFVLTIAYWTRRLLKGRVGSIRLSEKSDPMAGLLNGGFQSQGKVD